MKVELALRLNIWNHNPAGGRPEKPKRKRPAPGTSPADRAGSCVKPSSICHNDIGPPLGRLAAAFGHDPTDLWRLKENSGRRLDFKSNTQPPLDDCFHYNAWWNRLFRLKERLILDQLPSTLEKNIEANFKLFNIRPYRLLKWLNKLRQSQVVWKRWGRRRRGILSFPQGEVNIGTGDGRCKGAKSIGETMSR